ncbi:MAG: dihydroorotate dehydrogenase electron transfer subunit [Bacteroidales bacterium]|nr:dihydroorotate dehydrogenase electron transfer subunit [Bacteroidales bacterium]
MTRRAEDLKIVSRRDINEEYFVLDLQSGANDLMILPGQFVQIRVDNSRDTFLRRPISVYDFDSVNGIISLLIKVVGDGTRALSELKSGTKINIIYPLGNSFTLPGTGENVLLVGGGVGVAPLYLLGKEIHDRGGDPQFILGYRSDNQIIDYDKFSAIGNVMITTEDGSRGYHGMVTQHPRFTSRGYDRIFCCGPDPMMKAVASIALAKDIPCEVSLENMMACGIGVCLCCVADTVNGKVCTCTDGPVFNIKDLKWQI